MGDEEEENENEPTPAQLRSQRTVLRFQLIADQLSKDLKGVGLTGIKSLFFVQRYWQDRNAWKTENAAVTRDQSPLVYVANCCATWQFAPKHKAELRAAAKNEGVINGAITHESLEALFGAYKQFSSHPDQAIEATLEEFGEEIAAGDGIQAHERLIEAASALPYQGELPTAAESLVNGNLGIWFRVKADGKFEYRPLKTLIDEPAGLTWVDLGELHRPSYFLGIGDVSQEHLQGAFDSFLNPFLLGLPPSRNPSEPSYPKGTPTNSLMLALPCYQEWTMGDDGKKSSGTGAFLGWVFLRLGTFESDGDPIRRIDGDGTTDLNMNLIRICFNHFAERIQDAILLECIYEYADSSKGEDPSEAFKRHFPRIEGWRYDKDGTTKIVVSEGPEREFTLTAKDWTKQASDSMKVPPATVSRSARLYRALAAFHLAKESQTLKKYKQMLNLLESPLRGLSDAIIQMQSESQQLRSILYDPARSLFDAHEQLIGLFDEGKEWRVSDYVSVIVAHKPDNYKEVGQQYDDDGAEPKMRIGSKCDGYVILSDAIMGILGKKQILQNAQSRQVVIRRTRETLRSLEREKAFEELVTDLSFLLNREYRTKSDTELREILPSILDKEPGPLLAKLKRVLFDPFKPNDATWDTDAMVLAVKRYLNHAHGATNSMKTLSDPEEVFEGDFTVPAEFPATYNAVLDLMMECGAEAFNRTSSNPVLKLLLQTAGRDFERPLVIGIDFNNPYSSTEADHAQGRATLRKLITDYVFSQPRDWRISSFYAGNFQKPFLDFSGKILGINREWKPVPSSMLCGDVSILEIFRIEQVHGEGRFSLCIGDHPGIALIYWREKTYSGCPIKILQPNKTHECFC